MIGLITLSWAWAENVLAATIGLVERHAGPIKGHPEPPLSVKRRVSALRSALRDVPALHLLQEQGHALAVRFTELGRRRNDLVHSAAIQLHEGGVEFTRIAVRRGSYSIEDHRIDESDAVLLESEIAKLSDDATAFMLSVCAIFEN